MNLFYINIVYKLTTNCRTGKFFSENVTASLVKMFYYIFML